MSRSYWLERAWLGGPSVTSGVLVTVDAGRFTRVETVARAPDYTHRLAGLTIPGLANCHSHAFHRALRGRTQAGGGSFWTWREQMYGVAGALDPETYYDLALATYREMLASGITCVGEFHYLHHQPDGTPYNDPNEMGLALVSAARDAGIRITLLDTCYLASGIGQAPEGVQVRYSDGDVERWQQRAAALASAQSGPDVPDVVVGAAIHSVRAVPREQVKGVVTWAEERRAPLHVHLSEQPAENESCLAAYGLSPTAVLDAEGALGVRTSAVHATHLSEPDIELLGQSSTRVTFCPTTERDLGDGIGPSRSLHRAGARLTLGTDSHAVIDMFEEMRAVEMDERLASRRRGHWSAEELLVAATRSGHESLGFADAGRIETGGRADLVTLDTSSVRTAGTGADLAAVVFAATASDVSSVVAGGRQVATGEDRAEVGRELDRVLQRVKERS